MGRAQSCFDPSEKRIAMGEWMNTLEARASRNVLIVAMANKLTRIAWAALSSGQRIDERAAKMAYLKPVWSNGPYTVERFRRTGTAAYLIMARRLIPTKKAD